MIKTKEEIAKIKKNGKIVRKILQDLAEMAKPGVSTWELNKYAEEQIAKALGRPSFKGYGDPPFPGALCTSINDCIVHGAPSKKDILKEGDIIGLDLGMEQEGLFTDTAITVPVGKISTEAEKLLKVTKEALNRAIKQAIPGNKIGDISWAMQSYVEKNGFSVIRDLVGHGVGYDVHEEPHIPCFGKPGTGPMLKKGMVLAIEPMVSTGDYKLAYASDGFSIVMKDGSLGAHFEHTIAVREKGPEILT